ETFPVGERGLQWRPIRSRLGVEAFGVNAYTSAEIGGEVVEEHTEAAYGHEELYIVVSGRATFTLDGEEVDAPAGTLVHLPDPSVRRGAVASGRSPSTPRPRTGRMTTPTSTRSGTRSQRSPGSRTPAARSRNAGTGSCSGRATSSTAPCPGPASASTTSCRPTASANALWAL